MEVWGAHLNGWQRCDELPKLAGNLCDGLIVAIHHRRNTLQDPCMAGNGVHSTSCAQLPGAAMRAAASIDVCPINALRLCAACPKQCAGVLFGRTPPPPCMVAVESKAQLPYPLVWEEAYEAPWAAAGAGAGTAQAPLWDPQRVAVQVAA